MLKKLELPYEGKAKKVYKTDDPTCRFWDCDGKKSPDKDCFRHDPVGVEDAYKEIYKHLCGH
jgi:phosphoribosylaminoimidazole-succinocarboxamide synthase